MNQFKKIDNTQTQHLFEQAAELGPDFAVASLSPARTHYFSKDDTLCARTALRHQAEKNELTDASQAGRIHSAPHGHARAPDLGPSSKKPPAPSRAQKRSHVRFRAISPHVNPRSYAHTLERIKHAEAKRGFWRSPSGAEAPWLAQVQHEAGGESD